LKCFVGLETKHVRDRQWANRITFDALSLLPPIR
jgi:hypothetical protein